MMLLAQCTERFAVGFHDPRALVGSVGDLRTDAQRWHDYRQQAWDWIDRQWELWPRPELQRAILPPPFLRPSVRSAR